jgi:hypothetical protein
VEVAPTPQQTVVNFECRLLSCGLCPYRCLAHLHRKMITTTTFAAPCDVDEALECLCLYHRAEQHYGLSGRAPRHRGIGAIPNNPDGARPFPASAPDIVVGFRFCVSQANLRAPYQKTDLGARQAPWQGADRESDRHAAALGRAFPIYAEKPPAGAIGFMRSNTTGAALSPARKTIMFGCLSPKWRERCGRVSITGMRWH